MTQAAFDYYSTAQTPADCAKWITFIRLFSYVRTPACIYSKVITPSSKPVWRNVHAIAVPDYISNILAECFEEVSAREADLQLENLHVSDASMLKDLYIEAGMLPVVGINSTFKPRELGAYGRSRASVVRLGSKLVSRCARSVQVDESTMTRLMVRCVEQLGRLDLEPAALWPDEMDWLSRHDGKWTWGVMYVEGDR